MDFQNVFLGRSPGHKVVHPLRWTGNWARMLHIVLFPCLASVSQNTLDEIRLIWIKLLIGAYNIYQILVGWSKIHALCPATIRSYWSQSRGCTGLCLMTSSDFNAIPLRCPFHALAIVQVGFAGARSIVINCSFFPKKIETFLWLSLHEYISLALVRLHYLRRRIPVDARTEVIGDAVPVEEALVPYHVLRLQPDLDHVQRGHKQRHYNEEGWFLFLHAFYHNFYTKWLTRPRFINYR